MEHLQKLLDLLDRISFTMREPHGTSQPTLKALTKVYNNAFGFPLLVAPKFIESCIDEIGYDNLLQFNNPLILFAVYFSF
jgi:hypothetical protein